MAPAAGLAGRRPRRPAGPPPPHRERPRSWDRDGPRPTASCTGAPVSRRPCDWLPRPPDDPNPLEREFLDASRGRSGGGRRRREARARRRLRRALVAVAVVAVLALVAGGLAFQQRGNARIGGRRPRRRRSGRDRPTGRAGADPRPTPTCRCRCCWRPRRPQRDTSPETLGALQRVLVAADNNLGFIPTDGPLRNVFYDGADRLVGFTDTELIVWDATTHERISAIALPAPLLDGGFPNVVRASFAGGRAAWVDDVVRRPHRPPRPPGPGRRRSDPTPRPSPCTPTASGSRWPGSAVTCDWWRCPAAPSDGCIPGDPAITFDDQTPVDLSPIPALASIQLRTPSPTSRRWPSLPVVSG